MADKSGRGLMMTGAVVTFVGLGIVLIKTFRVPDYAVLVVLGIGLFVLGLIRWLTYRD